MFNRKNFYKPDIKAYSSKSAYLVSKADSPIAKISDIYIMDGFRIGYYSEITSLFIDLRDSTYLSINDEKKYFQTISTIFQIAIEETGLKEGFVDNFIGDAVLSVFMGKGQNKKALDAAIRVRNRLKAESERQSKGEDGFRVGIGIECGKAFIGTFDNYFQSETCVIGVPTNVSFKIQACFSKNWEIAIGQNFYKKNLDYIKSTVGTLGGSIEKKSEKVSKKLYLTSYIMSF